MKPFWHPLSTLLLEEPACYATPAALRLLLRVGSLELRYAGDRMWPAVEHGARLRASPRRAEGPAQRGSGVIVEIEGIPELARVVEANARSVRVGWDADPAPPCWVSRDALIADVVLTGRTAWPGLRALRRFALELREAWTARPDPASDPAATVLDKYEAQSASYRVAGAVLEPRLLERVRECVAEGGRVLVVGSGVGTESFGLAEAGFDVTGLDASPGMVAIAEAEARRRHLGVRFLCDDVRSHGGPAQAHDAVLFTYDVYSFLPAAAERVAMLRAIARWLAPQGALFVSARRIRRSWERALVDLQWLARADPTIERGDSHTRWIDSGGRLRRSFVHLFSESDLASEAAAGGFQSGPWEGAHALWRPLRTAIIAGR